MEHTKVLMGTRVEKAVELITSKVKRYENKILPFSFSFFLSMLVSWEALSSFPFPEKKDFGCQNGRNKDKSSY